MRHQGLSVFPLFFGISLLEALQGRHWVSAALWLCVGAFFVVMDGTPRVSRSPRARGLPR